MPQTTGEKKKKKKRVQKLLNQSVIERLLQWHSRYVREVERCRGWEDVGVIFGAGLLETMQRRVAVILCEALVLVAFSGKLNCCVL